MQARRAHDWAILGASVRTRDGATREKLLAQNGLAILIELGRDSIAAEVMESMIGIVLVERCNGSLIVAMADPRTQAAALPDAAVIWVLPSDDCKAPRTDTFPIKLRLDRDRFPCQLGMASLTKGADMLNPEDIAKMAADYTSAWNSKSAEAVASFYAEDGSIIINNGDPWSGQSGVQDMAAGFYADVPDLTLTCDDVRSSGTHVIYVWTFTGHDAKSGNPLTVRGWEEWEIDGNLKVKASRGWFDAEDYARQAEGR
jgi:uncharacterized protein (TIGR02246 family)